MSRPARTGARVPRIRKTVFPNGLTLVTERCPHFQSLAIGAWVKVGTRDEGKLEAGMSHFLEHMLFKGTKNRTTLQIAREIDQVGGEFNAFTSREQTCFHLLLLNRDLGLGMDILGDILLNSTFATDEFERERKVILQEVAMVDESPEEVVHDLYLEQLYGRHGLGLPILGSAASLRRMKRGDLVRFFRRYYRPKQIVISVAGDVSHEAVVRAMRPLSRGDWGRGCSPAPAELSPAPTIRDGFNWVPTPTEQAHLIWGVPGPRYDAPDRDAAHVLNAYLGGGMSSELFQEIREKRGLAYTVYSNLSPFRDSGYFSVYVGTAPGQLPLCLKLIEEAATKLCAHELPELELELVRDSLKGTIRLSYDSSESRMFNNARNEIHFGQAETLAEIMRRIDAVGPRAIQRSARKLFAQTRPSILVMGPRLTPALRKKLGNREIKVWKR